MKVVVVGMLDRQVKQAGYFPYLDIRYSNKEAKHGTGNEALFANADRLLVMTKFVSHGLTDKLDRSKVTWIDGGISKLRERLSALNDAARIQGTPKQTHTTIEEDLEDMARPSPFDFDKLVHAQTNEVVSYDRPEGMDPDHFAATIRRARSYYGQRQGLDSEQTFRGGKNKIDVLIKRSIADARRIEENNAALLEAAKASNHAAAVAESAQSAVSFSAEVSSPLKHADRARDVWTMVLTSRLQCGIDQALWEAQKAAEAYTKMFG